MPRGRRAMWNCAKKKEEWEVNKQDPLARTFEPEELELVTEIDGSVRNVLDIVTKQQLKEQHPNVTFEDLKLNMFRGKDGRGNEICGIALEAVGQ